MQALADHLAAGAHEAPGAADDRPDHARVALDGAVAVGVRTGDQQRVVAVVPIEFDGGHAVFPIVTVAFVVAGDLHGAVAVADAGGPFALGIVEVRVPGDDFAVRARGVFEVEVRDDRRRVVEHHGRRMERRVGVLAQVLAGPDG